MSKSRFGYRYIGKKTKFENQTKDIFSLTIQAFQLFGTPRTSIEYSENKILCISKTKLDLEHSGEAFNKHASCKNT